MSRYFHNLAVSLDQLANTILAGYPDETLSSRSWRQREKSPFWRFMVKFINCLTLNKNHCHDAFYKEIDLPEEYSNSWDKKY